MQDLSLKNLQGKPKPYADYLAAGSPNQALIRHLSFHLADTAPSEELLSMLLAECALRLLVQAMPRGTFFNQQEIPLEKESLLLKYMTAPSCFSEAASLVDDLIPKEATTKKLLSQEAAAFLLPVTYLPFEDTLGFLYLSLKHLGSRKSSGAYYTPPQIVRQIMSELAAFFREVPDSDTPFSVLDPSCGTGNLLLHLPENVPLSNIYGMDTDASAAALTRINLLLREFKMQTDGSLSLSPCLRTLRANIRVADFLLEDGTDVYRCILGNPPWGSVFSKEEKTLLKRRFSCTSHARPEAYVLFLEQALRLLAQGGRLSFVLPEAVLTVRKHADVRRLLLSETSIRSLFWLGNCFDDVFCPSILLNLEKTGTPHSCIGMRVTTPEQTAFTIRKERQLSAENFCLFSEDNAYALLEKLLSVPDCASLKGNADFALGIVTGDNRTKLRPAAPPCGDIPVLRGPDILPYHIRTPSFALTVPLSSCQQTAPEEFYHAPEKLVYRFIAERLTFAYDNQGYVTLNSCNIVIPHIDGLAMRYILAVLNSRVLQFLYKERFRSVKVLRSHLEQLPIPFASKKEQEEILSLVTVLQQTACHSGPYRSAYEQLEEHIAALFSLTQEEYRLIREKVTKNARVP